MTNASNRNEKPYPATSNPKSPLAGSKKRRKSGLAFRPSAERLDERLVLATLATTTVAGASVGQTLANVVNNSALGGLTVESTAGFSTTAPPDFLTLSSGGSPFATVSYITTTGTAFQTLALPAGNSTVQLSGSTVVTQAASGQAAAGNPQQLSASPFVLNMTGSSANFTPSGNLYVQGAKGNYIIAYASVSDVGGNAQFQGCSIVGSFGALQTSPFQDVVNAGAFIVQSVAPAGGQTTSINPNPITVQASVPGDPSQNFPFTLPVLSSAGFATATANDPKYTLVYFSDGTMAVVSYTGISQVSTGGYELTGCISQVAGTIGAFGATSGPTANVQWTSAAPIDFQFTNNSGQSTVYVAIAGQQIDPVTGIATYGFLSPAGSGGSSAGDLWKFEAFSGQTSVPTTVVFSTSDQAGAVKHLLIPNDPYKRLDSIRMIFSVGTAPNIPVISGKPSFPAAGNPSDPNDSTTYDFVEFTERSSPNDGILFINTTQVDQVGIPFLMQTTPADSVKSNGVGITVSRSELFYQFGQYVTQQFSGLTGTAATNAVQAFTSLTTPNRLLNPSDAITNPPAPQTPAVFETYFDAALTAFFQKYQQPGQTFRFQRDGYYFSGQTVTGYTPAPYSATATNNGVGLLIPPNGNAPTSLVFSIGQALSGPGVPSGATITGVSVDGSNVTTVSYSPAGTSQSAPATYSFSLPGGYTVLQLKETDSNWNVIQGGQQYQIYAPYFSNGSPYPTGFPASSTSPPVAPPWVAPATAASAGLMVFGNLGAFADGASQATMGQISGTNASGQILLDIENSIVSAFNRGIANAVPAGTDVTSAWNDNTTFYPTPSQDGSNWSNFYAGFLHNDNVSVTAPGSPIGLAYGFAYDDQGGNDPTLVSYASRVAITLQPWTAATSIVISPAHLQTVVGQTTQITVTAYRDKDRKIVDTTYLGKIEFDPEEVAAGLPRFYQFTPADNGTKTFTFVPKKAGTIEAEVSDPANRLDSTTAVWQIAPGRIAFAAGTDAGTASIVKLFDDKNVEVLEIVPFEPSFKGGVRVAVGDVNGDGYSDVAIISGPGMVTELKVFDGRDGRLIQSMRPFGDTFEGGGFIASGDFDGNGRADFALTSGPGIATRLVVVDGMSSQPLWVRAAFHHQFAGGATVATSDLNADGYDEIIVGAGAGGGGRIRIFDGRTARVRNAFLAFGPGFHGSIEVAGGDVIGGDGGEIIVSGQPSVIVRPPQGPLFVFDGRGRRLARIQTSSGTAPRALRIATRPDEARPGKGLVIVDGGPGTGSLETYRLVNVSPFSHRPNYRSNLVDVVFPLGNDYDGGFYLSGRQSIAKTQARSIVDRYLGESN